MPYKRLRLETPSSMDIPVSSAIITTFYFVFLELGLERFVLHLTSQVQAHELCRAVRKGHCVSTTPSNIPLLGEGLRHRSSCVTFCVLLLRLALIIAIFCLNFGTEGASKPISTKISRDYIAYQNAADSVWFRNGTYTFTRDFNALSGCARETQHGLDYFDLALDLMSGQQRLYDLDDTSQVPPASRIVDFAKMVCLDGVNFLPRKLAMRVQGCGPRAAECKPRPLNTTWNTLKWEVNTLSRGIVQKRAIEGSTVTGLQAGQQMAECVHGREYANCAVWNSSTDTKMIKITIMNSNEILHLQAAENGSTVELSMLDASGTAVLRGGSFGRISVAHAIVDSTARYPPDILTVINKIFSRSVEYRPNEEELFMLSGSQPVTRIDDLALAGAVALGVTCMLSLSWALTERCRSGSGIGWWKFTSNGLLTVWKDDVTAICEKGDMYPIVHQTRSEQGIVVVGALKTEGDFG